MEVRAHLLFSLPHPVVDDTAMWTNCTAGGIEARETRPESLSCGLYRFLIVYGNVGARQVDPVLTDAVIP